LSGNVTTMRRRSSLLLLAAALAPPSPHDTPQRYADAFRVMHKDGTVHS
jgi:hypothetical protein